MGTANGYTNVPDFGSSDAVIAFDLDTGERIWSTQLLAGDQNCGAIDMSEEELDSKCPLIKWGANDDVSGSPVLLPLPDGTELLVAGQESGRITALNPESGAKVWVIQTGEDEGFPPRCRDGGCFRRGGITTDQALIRMVPDGWSHSNRQRVK